METGNFAPWNGTLEITPIGHLRDGPKVSITDKDGGNLRGNARYTRLLKVHKPLGQVLRSLVRLIPGTNNKNNQTKVSVKSISFNILSHTEPE